NLQKNFGGGIGPERRLPAAGNMREPKHGGWKPPLRGSPHLNWLPVYGTATGQSLTVPSAPAVAILSPSGVNATPMIDRERPGIVCSSLPSAASHNLRAPSSWPLAMMRLSGLNATLIARPASSDSRGRS